ncbi:MAG: fumarylacetoacetase [Saprospiraceae bacterium]|nr:fumarylacetoacetase [Saprospiraceae bacterium]
MNEALIISAEKKSWVSYAPETGFPIQNLPLGVFRYKDHTARICSRIGDYVVDLYGLSSSGLLKLEGFQPNCFLSKYLNPLLEKGKASLRNLRSALAQLLDEAIHPDLREKISEHFFPADQVLMLLPIKAGNYTDFYSSREHAYNVGVMFRDPANALLPNWLHMPIGYHGRASSIVVSGTPIVRPCGQMVLKDGEAPVFGPSRQLDFELEMGFVVGKGNEMGHPIPIKDAEEHIHGLVIFNDWSARDLQKWEYVPLGPFLGKNFASSVSPWLIDLDALQTFKVAGPAPEKPLLEYLQKDGPQNYDIQLEVWLITPDGGENLISTSNMKYLYWSMVQQLAHHTVNGCNMEVGDVCASGTISGPAPDSYGSMLELAWKGTKALKMQDGSERTFVRDGDTIVMKAFAQNEKYRIGFGEVRGMVLPPAYL